ncbi:PspC domain-containing protein [Brachybacterium subflavum]|uniref:PspC domain-containing protein n=1 Tax=Brachybacterium subflavum TaxID=2585206 RepID=UPI0018797EEF|nr:PspC domain-containing protein [Brachybacterium subflavum]
MTTPPHGPDSSGASPDAPPGESAPHTENDEAGRPRFGFFAWMRGIGLVRSDERWIAGVCGAISERTGLDPLLVRGIAIVVALLGGPVLIAYAIGWALLPDIRDEIVLEDLFAGIFAPAQIAIGVLILLGLTPYGQGLWWRGAPDWWSMPGWLETTMRTAWALVLVGILAWLVVLIARRTGDHAGHGRDRPHGTRGGSAASANTEGPSQGQHWSALGAAPRAPRAAGHHGASFQQRSADRRAHEEDLRHRREERLAERAARWRRRQPSAGFVAIGLGMALVVGALVALSAQALGWSDAPLIVGLAGALAVLAIATVVAGIRGRESGGLGLFSFIAVIALVVFGVVPAGTQISPFGDTQWTVDAQSIGTTERFAMIAGSPGLDLRDLSPADRGGDVEMWLGAGTTQVLLPDDAPVRVEVDGLVAGVRTPDTRDSQPDGTLLASTELENPAARTADDEDITTVHVRVLFGTADIDIQETP